MTHAGRKRVVTCGLIAAAAALSLLDHAGVFGYRGDDRLCYDGANCTVTRVIDGDTLEVDLPDGNRPTTLIRLRGIDAPDIAHATVETDAFYGPEATEFLRKQVGGRRVTLRLDPNRPARDNRDQLLAYVHLEGELESVNERLIKAGCAYADGRMDHVFMLQFTRLETAAGRGKIGLWAGITPEQMPPWRRRMDETPE
ncbi:hypothetical protein B7486_08590 [cyanobacterium TDX16]|nr:hypothetical protein B7486_08590 [cyanobacterium TDX16]